MSEAVAAKPLIVFTSERVAAVWPELSPLSQQHWAEVTLYPDIPLDPNIELYERMDAAGVIRVFTARDGDGKLVGYSVFFVAPDIRCRGSLQATMEILFILPEHRGFGKEFIEWCDEQLRDEKVQVIIQHVDMAFDFSPVFVRLGYTWAQKVFTRRLF